MKITIGQYLRKKREENRKSIEVVATATKIRAHYIESIEEDQYDVFPSLTQAKGFVKVYAEYLQLDSEPIIDSLNKKSIHLGDEFSITDEKTIPLKKFQQTDSVQDVEDKEEKTEKEEPKPVIKVERKKKNEKSAVSKTSDEENYSKSDLIFSNLGKKLKNQREALGLTLNDIERYTHVRVYYLQSIEDGEFLNLPSPVQAKGMIENYASFIDLDTEAILLEYADGLQVQRNERLINSGQPVAQSPKPKPKKPGFNFRRLLSPDLIFIPIIIILLVILSIWGVSQIVNNQGSSNETAEQTVTDSVITSQNEEEVISPEVNGTEENLQSGNETLEPTITLEGQSIPTNTLPPSNDPLQLFIVAKQNAYLNVVADDVEVFNGRLNAGDAYPFSAKQILEIKTGNAAGIQVIFNEEDLGIIGAYGEVKHLFFTIEGIVTPTSIYTPSQTPTITETPTIEPTETEPVETVTPYVPE